MFTDPGMTVFSDYRYLTATTDLQIHRVSWVRLGRDKVSCNANWKNDEYLLESNPRAACCDRSIIL